MTRQDIERELSRAGRQPFVTITDIAERMGVSEKTASRRVKEMDINAINGKYYFYKEVADGLAIRLQKRSMA